MKNKIVLCLLVCFILALTGCTANDPYSEDVYYGENVYIGDVIGFGNSTVHAEWSAKTINDTGTILDLDGIVGENFVVPPNSVIGFELLVVAKDTSGDIALFSIENGSIKRAGVGTSVIITYTLNRLYRDDVDWDITVTALGATDVLAITVIGDIANQTVWSAVLYGVIAKF